MHSRGILYKAEGDYLDRVSSDQKVFETIRRGRPVLLSEANGLKTNSKKTTRLESTQI